MVIDFTVEATAMLGLDQETLLDLTVNIIPLIILVFFMIYFLIVDPWSSSLWLKVLGYGLLVIPLVLLALLSYIAGRLVARDEHRLEEEQISSGSD